ncbi:MAG TPA: hypothetical protein VGO92_05365 [Acidimicrobiales bacterium]|jgi:hypothetical protein|nr:hypothetical protein [Acidimicrobiales bacterium]
MIAERLVRLVAWVGVAFFFFFGLWAFFDPASFFDKVAIFPPYNAHFLHDAGAFQIGLGTSLLLGLLGWGGLGTALGGAGLGSVVHVIAHVIDRDQGGRATDPVGLGLLALALLWGAWVVRPRRGR